MSGKLNRHAYEQMIAEDLAWLNATTFDTLERRHIIEIMGRSADHEYTVATDEISSLRARIAVLESALRKHGHHSSVCSFGRDPGDPCDCWIAVVLATASP